jgi:hypothetical protein
VILRELFGGKIRLVAQLDGVLMAHWDLHPGALLKGPGTYGSGGRYELYSDYLLQIQAVVDSVSSAGAGPLSADQRATANRNRACCPSVARSQCANTVSKYEVHATILTGPHRRA